MKYDIATMLTEMLKDAGASDLIEGDLSNHYTISLNMKNDISPILIKEESDGIWVWSKICEYNENALFHNSTSIVSLLMEHNEEFFYVGQPCLYVVDNNLELRAQIKNDKLNSTDDFSSVLNEYFLILEKYIHAIR